MIKKSAFSIVETKKNNTRFEIPSENLSNNNWMLNRSQWINKNMNEEPNKFVTESKLDLSASSHTSSDKCTSNWEKDKDAVPNYLLKDWKTPKRIISIPIPLRHVSRCDVGTQTNDLNSMWIQALSKTADLAHDNTKPIIKQLFDEFLKTYLKLKCKFQDESTTDNNAKRCKE